jgi:TonB family protein
MLGSLTVQPNRGSNMSTVTRSFAQHTFHLAAAAALATAATWASAAEITLAAVSPPQPAPGASVVQDLGRIEAAAGYDARVRAELVRHARYPADSQAGLRRLSGKVDVDFEVNPDGSLKQAAVARSSDSHALDGAALKSVGRARFSPIPAGTQADGQARRYFVTFDYRYPEAN